MKGKKQHIDLREYHDRRDIHPTPGNQKPGGTLSLPEKLLRIFKKGKPGSPGSVHTALEDSDRYPGDTVC